MKINNIYAVRLREIREDRGLSAASVAAALGIHPSTLANYENGAVCPSVKMLIQIADLFSVSLDYLIAHDTSRSMDTTTEQVCRYTGLSPQAVRGLHKTRNFRIEWR